MDDLHLLSIDLGTTHIKGVLYKHETGILGQEVESIETYYPQPGFAEQDPEEILSAVVKVIQRLMERSQVPPRAITALVFDGIMQSLMPVDRDDAPLGRAWSWADTRSLAQNTRLKQKLDAEEVKQRTGCTLHPMYFASRLAWIREETPEVFERTARFISVKEYVLRRLFDVRVVDRSVASGTGVFNMHALDWDAALLAEVGVSPDRFSPTVEPTTLLSNGLSPAFASRLGLLPGTPGVIGAYDGGHAHLGSVGLAPERISFTVATGAALRRHMREPTVIRGSEAWCYYLADGNWLLGGVMHDAGAALAWFADQLMPAAASEAEAFGLMNHLAAEVPPGADGLYFIPLLGGERCPHYRPEARGVLYGLTFSHGRSHFIRALMEGLAFNLYSVYRMLAPNEDPACVVNGGILKSPVWLKIVADFFGQTLWLPKIQEVSAWGGILLALKALGVLPDLEHANELIEIAGRQDPDPAQCEFYRGLRDRYARLYSEVYGAGIDQKIMEA